jgi:hypothetical protein
VLSPISDKSQEQSSENPTTPKVSPNEDDYSNANRSSEPPTDNKRTEESSETSRNDNYRVVQESDDEDRDGTIAKALDVPWDVPKLKRRLQTRQNLNQLQQEKTLDGLRGSDSGISMTSQEQEMRELLNVPWDMPKLRKKTEHMQLLKSSSTRPTSMPASTCFALNRPATMAGAPPPEQSGVVNLGIRIQNIPPPPPGFEDSGDEFYLGKPNGAGSGGAGVDLDNRPSVYSDEDEDEDGKEERMLLRKGLFKDLLSPFVENNNMLCISFSIIRPPRPSQDDALFRH